MAARVTTARPDFRLSSSGYAELARMEGNVPYVYDDLRLGPLRPLTSYAEARGTPTIGLGVAIQSEADRQKYAVYLTRSATPAELELINRTKLAEFEHSLNAKLAGAALTQGMFDALFSLMWNAGPNNSALRQAIEAVRAGNYAAAQQAIASGPTTSKGRVLEVLVRRRAKEAQMFAAEVAAEASEAVAGVQKNPWPYLAAVGLVTGAAFLTVRLLAAR